MTHSTSLNEALWPARPTQPWLKTLAIWQQVFKCDARPYVFLNAPCRHQFHTGLIAAWQASKHVIVAPHRRAPLRRCIETLPCYFVPHTAEAAALDVGANAPPPPAEHSAINDAAAFSLFTSGSAGLPTQVRKPAASLAAEIKTLQRHFRQQIQDSTLFCSAGHHHIYGLLYSILWPAFSGQKVAPRMTQAEQLHQALLHSRETNGTRNVMLCVTPTFLARLLDANFRMPADMQCGLLISSGAPLPGALAQFAAAHLCAVTEIFGSTECGGIAWRQHCQPEPPWQSFDNVRWKIRDGCLAVASPHTGLTNYFRTADGAAAHGETFVLTGRTDRMYKFREKQVSLPGLEAVLLKVPDIAQARVAVCPRSDLLRIAVVLRQDSEYLAFARHQQDSVVARLQGVLRPNLPMAMPLPPTSFRLVGALGNRDALKVGDHDVLALFE